MGKTPVKEYKNRKFLYPNTVVIFWTFLEGLVHQKLKMMSLMMTHPHIIPRPSDRRSSPEHSLRYFRFSQRAFYPFKMYVRYTVLVQKGNKDIIQVVHVTSVG